MNGPAIIRVRVSPQNYKVQIPNEFMNPPAAEQALHGCRWYQATEVPGSLSSASREFQVQEVSGAMVLSPLRKINEGVWQNKRESVPTQLLYNGTLEGLVKNTPNDVKKDASRSEFRACLCVRVCVYVAGCSAPRSLCNAGFPSDWSCPK